MANQHLTHIKSKIGWLDFNFKELWNYKDLVFLFFKRNYSTRYKQTVLGPMWLVLRPLLSVVLYAFVFGHLAGLSTEGTPPFVFYLCSNALWSFFSTSLSQTSATFTANSSVMGKVYFPRLVMPLSSVLTGMLDLFIQLAMLIVVMAVYFLTGHHFGLGLTLALTPVLIIQAGLLGLGCGIIISALTTKYRDLAILVEFGVQLWMYASPVVYTSELIPEKLRTVYMLNPMAPVMEIWRSAVIGSGAFSWFWWAVSWIETAVMLVIGIILFNKVEKTFMDTV